MVDGNRLARARLSEFVGEGFRHLSPPRSLSGEGARLHGGRFNPSGSFPVLYVCRTGSCASGRATGAWEPATIGVDGLLPVVSITTRCHPAAGSTSRRARGGRRWCGHAHYGPGLMSRRPMPAARRRSCARPPTRSAVSSGPCGMANALNTFKASRTAGASSPGAGAT